MNNKGADQTAQMHRLVCAFVVRIQQSQVFPCRGPYKILYCFNNSRKICRDPITHSDLSFLESYAAKSLVKSLQICHCFSSKTEKLKVNSCHEGYFRVLHPHLHFVQLIHEFPDKSRYIQADWKTV